MKTHSHTFLFAFAAWLVVGCGSNLNIGDPAPAPATSATASPDPAPAPTSSSPATPPSSSLMPCPTGTLCWANTDSTRNNLVSAWASDADNGVWSVTRHGEIVHWDGVSQKVKFRLDGTFDDALVWGTAADNVYAFFHRAKTPSEPFGATTVVRLHDGAFQVHASSGAYALGALRTVEVPRLGVVAVLSKAHDPASVVLVDADLEPQLALPALPLASGSGATLDESLDATASVSEGGVLSVWVLTRAGRVFRWTEGGAGWSELRPFPTSDDPTELPRGTGLAPTRVQNINGVQVIRDVFRGQHLRREIATLEGSDAVVTSLPNRPVYSAGDILPHGRSVSYNPSPGIFDWDRPLVDSGRWCFSLGCRSWGTVDSQENGVWTNTALPMDGAPLILGATRSTRYAVGVGGQVHTRERSTSPANALDAMWVRVAGQSSGDQVVALDALADDDVWALEHRAGTYQARHYDGRTWSEGFRAPRGGVMLALKDSAWFTGSPDATVDDTDHVSRWKAGQWTTFSVGARVSLLAKDGPDSLWAIGHETTTSGALSPRLYRWDGTAWSGVGDPFSLNERFSGLSAAGGVVWATGNDIYRREGARADKVECPGRPPETRDRNWYGAVLALGDKAGDKAGDEAWVVDAQSTLFHISGTTCTAVGSVGENLSVRSIVGVHPSDVWIVGFSIGNATGPRLVHWNGRTLEPAKLAFDPVFLSASVSPLGTLWVGATHGAILRSAVPKPN